MSASDQAKAIARRVVEKQAPAEVIIFEEVWLDFERDPDQELDAADNVEREVSLGPDSLGTVLTAVIIPVVVNVLSKTISSGIEAIARAVRDRAKGRLDDDKVEQIASAIMTETQDVVEGEEE